MKSSPSSPYNQSEAPIPFKRSSPGPPFKLSLDDPPIKMSLPRPPKAMLRMDVSLMKTSSPAPPSNRIISTSERLKLWSVPLSRTFTRFEDGSLATAPSTPFPPWINNNPVSWLRVTVARSCRGSKVAKSNFAEDDCLRFARARRRCGNSRNPNNHWCDLPLAKDILFSWICMPIERHHSENGATIRAKKLFQVLEGSWTRVQIIAESSICRKMLTGTK